MAWKVYTSNNYLVLENTTGKTLRRLKYQVTVKKENLTGTLYDFWDAINSYARIEFDDLQDQTGTPWADAATLEAFINANTGLGDSSSSTTKEDGAAIIDFDFSPMGGKSVIAETYVPAYAVDESVQAAFSHLTGRLLVQDDHIEAVAETTLSVRSVDTNYIFCAAIDLRGYQLISILPEVTETGGTNAYYIVQWSFDALNWFNETIDTPNVEADSEQIITQNVMVRDTPSTIAQVMPNSAVTLEKRARYIRIGQKSNAGETIISCVYHFQKLKK